jgi:hypothetical protein
MEKNVSYCNDTSQMTYRQSRQTRKDEAAPTQQEVCSVESPNASDLISDEPVDESVSDDEVVSESVEDILFSVPEDIEDYEDETFYGQPKVKFDSQWSFIALLDKQDFVNYIKEHCAFSEDMQDNLFNFGTVDQISAFLTYGGTLCPKYEQQLYKNGCKPWVLTYIAAQIASRKHLSKKTLEKMLEMQPKKLIAAMAESGYFSSDEVVLEIMELSLKLGIASDQTNRLLEYVFKSASKRTLRALLKLYKQRLLELPEALQLLLLQYEDVDPVTDFLSYYLNNDFTLSPVAEKYLLRKASHRIQRFYVQLLIQKPKPLSIHALSWLMNAQDDFRKRCLLQHLVIGAPLDGSAKMVNYLISLNDESFVLSCLLLHLQHGFNLTPELETLVSKLSR